MDDRNNGRTFLSYGLLVLLSATGLTCRAAAGGVGKEAKPVRLCDLAESHPRPQGAPKRSDVSMRLFRKHKGNAEIAAGKAFHITRADWSYIRDAEYIKKVKELGWTFQGSIAGITRNADHAMKNRDGSPRLDHFKKPGRYWADMNNAAYRQWYVDELVAWVEAGADAIQRDEPTTCRRTPVPVAARFFKDVNARFKKRIGRHVPMSCNLAWNESRFGGRGHAVATQFDFGMAEFFARLLKPETLMFAARDTERRGKAMIYTGGAHMSKADIRVAIAGCYANGINYIVPWDQFTGIGKPRMFGKPEDFADLYGFVRGVARCLDGYEAAVGSIPIALRARQVRQSLADELFGGRAFTVVMVTRSEDGTFGVGGNGPAGSGGIPRLYLRRNGFSYNILQGAPSGSKAGAVEITTFVHDGKDRITVYRDGRQASALEGEDHTVKPSFGNGGHLSIPFNGGDRNHPGDMAELMAFRGELSAERLREVHSALKRKYLDHAAGDAARTGEEPGENLLLHLVADDLAKTLDGGRPVTRWQARTGQFAVVPRVRLSNGKAAAAPTFQPDAINGHAAVRFDGVDDLMRIVSVDAEAFRAPFSVAGGTGSGRLCVFARARPADRGAPVILHLVEWLGRPKPAVLELRTTAFFGNRPLRVELLTPVPYDRAAHEKAEAEKNYAPLVERNEVKVMPSEGMARVEIPALRPWGILIVSPAG